MIEMERRERVLLVEDDYSARTEMADVLRDAGYEVLEATDGPAALRLATQGDPAVILLDLILPDAAGFDLLNQLRALPGRASTPIVAVSGFEERVQEARLSGAPFDAYLVKPFGTAELLAVVAEGLAARKPART